MFSATVNGLEVDAVKLHRTAGRWCQSRDDFAERTFAGSVCPQQGMDLTAAYIQPDVVEHRDCVVAFGDVGCGEEWVHDRFQFSIYFVSAWPLTIMKRLIITVYFFSSNVFFVTRSTGVSTSSTAASGFSIIFRAVSIPNTAS